MTEGPNAQRDAAFRRNAAVLIVGLVLIAATIAALEWRRRMSLSQPASATVVSSPDAGTDAGVDAGVAVAPPTGDAQKELRRAAEGLSKQPEWESWLAEPHVISRLVAAAYRVAEGQNVPPLLLFFAADRELTVDSHDGKFFLGQETIASRQSITEVVTSIDPERAAAAYARLSPYFEVAFREIARPDQRLTPVIHQAIHELRATPVPATSPALVKNGTAYFFEDAQLEELPPAQKQLLRMGNANAQKIQQWLAVLDRALPP